MALRLDERLDDAWFGRGMARGRNGELDEAIADLGVYIRRNPNSSLAYTKRGVRQLWRGDVEAAERDFLKAIAWERERPDRVHSIEVYVYNTKGRVLRDDMAWYLPQAHNAPRVTSIDL